MNKFGEFLYELRKEKGLTQQELADKLNITNKAVSKWETGDAFPETAQLKPLARILGVSVDELLEGKRNGNAVSAGAEETRPEMKPMTTGEAIMTALSVIMIGRRIISNNMESERAALYVYRRGDRRVICV